ncbi:MAG: hypothetical protein ACF787_10355 [Rhodopirellula sp. JB053]
MDFFSENSTEVTWYDVLWAENELAKLERVNELSVVSHAARRSKTIGSDNGLENSDSLKSGHSQNRFWST